MSIGQFMSLFPLEMPDAERPHQKMDCSKAVTVIDTIPKLVHFKNELDALNKSKVPHTLIVAITATWCSHCRDLAPVFNAVAEESCHLGLTGTNNKKHLKVYNIQNDLVFKNDGDKKMNSIPYPFQDFPGFPTVFKIKTPYTGQLDVLKDRSLTSIVKFFRE